MKKNIKTINYKSLVTAKLASGTFIRKDFPGFEEDYLVIHCLIRKYKPRRFMEIGTSTGLGTKVIAQALMIKRLNFVSRLLKKTVFSKNVLYSIDVPPGTDSKIIYPGKEDGHPDKAGKYCDLPYVQLFGNSQNFDFTKYYPLDAWFIDGKHSYKYVKRDTVQALKSKPKLIIWHDTQIPEVTKAISEIMVRKRYILRFVKDTRIAFAVLDKKI